MKKKMWLKNKLLKTKKAEKSFVKNIRTKPFCEPHEYKIFLAKQCRYGHRDAYLQIFCLQNVWYKRDVVFEKAVESTKKYLCSSFLKKHIAVSIVECYLHQNFHAIHSFVSIAIRTFANQDADKIFLYIFTFLVAKSYFSSGKKYFKAAFHKSTDKACETIHSLR